MTWSHAAFLLQLFSPYQLRKNNVASEIKNISVARVELSPEINRYAEMENSTTAEALRIKDMDNYPSWRRPDIHSWSNPAVQLSISDHQVEKVAECHEGLGNDLGFNRSYWAKEPADYVQFYCCTFRLYCSPTAALWFPYGSASQSPC